MGWVMIYELKAGSHLFLGDLFGFYARGYPFFLLSGLHGAVVRTHRLTSFFILPISILTCTTQGGWTEKGSKVYSYSRRGRRGLHLEATVWGYLLIFYEFYRNSRMGYASWKAQS
jgi:hypothetical protein